MKLIKMIPIQQVKATLQQLSILFPMYSFVISHGYIKVYQQIR